MKFESSFAKVHPRDIKKCIQTRRNQIKSRIDEHREKLIEEHSVCPGFFGFWKKTRSREETIEYLKNSDDVFSTLWDRPEWQWSNCLEDLDKLERLVDYVLQSGQEQVFYLSSQHSYILKYL